MIHLVEELFGPRDTSYTVYQIETGYEVPQIMYYDNCPKGIYIRLVTDPAEYLSKACYQLAHETVHLLAPIRGIANNLEEGIATYFAGHYMKMNEPTWRPVKESYKEVLAKVKQSIDDNPYCIRELRRKNPNFSYMSRDEVYEVFKNHLTIEDAGWLLQKFERC